MRMTNEEFLEMLGNRYRVIRTGERDPIPWQTRYAVLCRDDWTCKRCGWRLDSKSLELDHAVPWSAGGSDRSENLRTLCCGCNQSRSNYCEGNEDRRLLPVTWWCVECSEITDSPRAWLVGHPAIDPERDDEQRDCQGRWACSQSWWSIVLAEPRGDLSQLLVPRVHTDPILAFCAHCMSTAYARWTL